jgi:hypothetical protein
MRFLLSLLLNFALLALVHFLMLPWFFDAIVLALVALLLFPKWWGALLAGLLATGAVWGFHASFLMDTPSDLPERMANLFTLSSPEALMWVTAAVGGIWGGIAALVGWSLRTVFSAGERTFKR